MPLVRIVKQYNRLSPKNGIIEVDKVQFKTPDEAARFVTAINANEKVEFDIIDWDVPLAHVGEGRPEIIENPTGGRTGKL